MSSSASRIVHQEYIARIRYSNALPPPPNPPKLLDIPNTGLASGQYTTPGFATRLARDQPLNIEADAELGMPLDLVGMPGIFDGDESSIQAPLHPPPIHPSDRNLLRPLATLGKPKFSEQGVSFLRRTEYISAYTSKSRFESTTSKSLVENIGNRRSKPAAPLPADRESPEYIKAQIEKSFQIAATNLKDRSRVRHPTKRNVKLVDAYPLLPDLDAFPDVGGYVMVKFLTNPVPPSNVYDVRLESSILRPVPPSEEEQRHNQAVREAYELDPDHNPPPDDKIEYEMFMPENLSDAKNFKRKFDVLDPDHDDVNLYSRIDDEGRGSFRLKRLRAYESAHTTGNVDQKYDEEVVIAVHDGTDGLRQRAAYYYPTVQRTSIRPQRNKNIQKMRGMIGGGEDEKVTDLVDLSIEDMSEDMKRQTDIYRTMPYGMPEEEGGDEDAEGERDDGPVVGAVGGKTVLTSTADDDRKEGEDSLDEDDDDDDLGSD
ncbi:hypothetical protein CJF31_00000109 [Rutstroemia sp. NJR-2017a BVV2]|nr:hypothetical protein CJF31_00000109 [Rutstroemia sp. NJR-2017a BVV2]